jgi:hypothetical protein
MSLDISIVLFRLILHSHTCLGLFAYKPIPINDLAKMVVEQLCEKL